MWPRNDSGGVAPSHVGQDYPQEDLSPWGNIKLSGSKLFISKKLIFV
jgi:hypothetical protein